ncbi:MAG: MopE-related protein [Saprospiraceae bacterium]|nr:MopE-related protein [Saprospiraceae bacterium]
MNRYLLHLQFLILFCFSGISMGQIAVDGSFDDWTENSVQIEENDNFPGLDLLSLAVSNDDDNLYIKIETDVFFDLQDDEFISIYIDADNNAGTGYSANGLGSEITYYFGSKSAFINYPTSTFNGNHSDLQLISLPTVTSNIFEVAIRRELMTDQGTMTMGNTISVSVDNGNGGDVIPNQSGGMEYQMQSLPSFMKDFKLEKTNNSLLRVMSWNVENDGFLDEDRAEHVKNVIQSMNPDVLALQEVYGTPMEDIANFLNENLPNDDGSSWQYAKRGQDVAVFTRDYLEASESIDGNGIFLLYDDENNPLIIYNVHLPCCDNDIARQLEIDHILSIVRDKQVSFLYEDNAPIIITGDFNMVGLVQNVTSMTSGDIVNENQYGTDFQPDWDGSDFEDVNPYVTGYPANYTWRNENSGYNPGKLDWMFYSGSVMDSQNGFVLNTEFLTSEELAALGLSQNETTISSDHLPIVTDFSFGVIDNDMDGFNSDEDCDDENADINPDAEEIANNDVDENCDGIVLIIDEDVDGFNSDEDCDDENADVNPDAEEIANNEVDENCDGIVLVIDEDMDGFNSDEDCDDENADINPDAEEIANNDVDENCDDIVLVIDEDMDGFNSDEDCDDGNADINPDAEEIANNDVDENCDDIVLVIDEDMDGFNSDEDCDDGNADINPEAEEIANNGIDEDCDGLDLITSVNTTDSIDFDIFPNPAQTYLSVSISDGSYYKMEIFNEMNQTIIQSLHAKQRLTIDLTNYSEGIYCVRLMDGKGNFSVKRFIVIR